MNLIEHTSDAIGSIFTFQTPIGKIRIGATRTSDGELEYDYYEAFDLDENLLDVDDTSVEDAWSPFLEEAWEIITNL